MSYISLRFASSIADLTLTHERCIFINEGRNKDIDFILIDILYAGCKNMVEKFETFMKKEYKLTSTLAVDTYIRLKLEQKSGVYFVNNQKHILNGCLQHGIDKIQKKTYIPISSNLTDDKSVKLYNLKVYQ
eukprot:snap_masked-scaffold_30-processed-gene-2.38-mRNA-1 protein AED:0.74 eAED:0.90 QI:0/0/0/0.66/1/1/3/0/130